MIPFHMVEFSKSFCKSSIFQSLQKANGCINPVSNRAFLLHMNLLPIFLTKHVSRYIVMIWSKCMYVNGLQFTNYVFFKVESRAGIHDEVNQLLQLCTARTAWSDSVIRSETSLINESVFCKQQSILTTYESVADFLDQTRFTLYCDDLVKVLTMYVNGLQFTNYVFFKVESRAGSHDEVNQLLQLCTARTAWSDSLIRSKTSLMNESDQRNPIR